MRRVVAMAAVEQDIIVPVEHQPCEEGNCPRDGPRPACDRMMQLLAPHGVLPRFAENEVAISVDRVAVL